VELAQRSGLGWRGKHTLLLNRSAGSLFFLGEIYLDRALPPTGPQALDAPRAGSLGDGPQGNQAGNAEGNACGSCTACLQACPTGAIVAPYRLDARRCISYLTIEHAGPIDPALRPLLGNRIYGCDDCQLACPWNKFAQRSVLPDFAVRPSLRGQDLVGLLGWTPEVFLAQTAGNPIRRIGHERWLRNLAVALGNALRVEPDAEQRQTMVAALQQRLTHDSALVREHVQWALAQAPGAAA